MASFFDGLLANVNGACTSTFGNPIVYTPAISGAASFTINGITGDPTELDDQAFGVAILLSFNSTDFPQPPFRGDQVTLPGGQVYEVQNIETDVEGMTVLTCLRNKTPDD